MDKMIYKIMVDGTVNDYMNGRISGIIEALSSSELSFGIEAKTMKIRTGFSKKEKDIIVSWIHRVEATQAEFTVIRNKIDKIYPGLCMYDCER